MAVSEDNQEVFEAYGSITWEEREEGVPKVPTPPKPYSAYALGACQQFEA